MSPASISALIPDETAGAHDFSDLPIWEQTLRRALLEDRAASGVVLEQFPELLPYTHMDGRLKQQRRLAPATRVAAAYDEYLRFQANDTFVISYPKSGRTWLRMLLGHYFSGGREEHVLDLERVARASDPSVRITMTHDDDPHLKPHTEIVVDKEIYRTKTVIFLTRDPLDVCVSNFFQHERRGGRILSSDDRVYGSIAEYIFDGIGGLKNVIGFYNAWTNARSIPKSFLRVSYEQLGLDPMAAMTNVIKALGHLQPDTARLAQAIDFCSFSNMRLLEEEDRLGDFRLRAFNKTDTESYKVRRGIIGGYRDYISPDTISELQRILQECLIDYSSACSSPNHERT
jgi:hypothetical protein